MIRNFSKISDGKILILLTEKLIIIDEDLKNIYNILPAKNKKIRDHWSLTGQFIDVNCLSRITILLITQSSPEA